MAKKNEVFLTGAARPYAGRQWVLQRTSRGLARYDEADELVTEIPGAEAAVRIKFPNVVNMAYLGVLDADGHYYLFKPEREAVGRVRRLVRRYVADDWDGAARVLRRHALRDWIIGVCSVTLGLIVTAWSFLAAAPGGTFVVTTGLLAVGAFEIVRGFYWLWKASQLGPPDDGE